MAYDNPVLDVSDEVTGESPTELNDHGKNYDLLIIIIVTLHYIIHTQLILFRESMIFKSIDHRAHQLTNLIIHVSHNVIIHDCLSLLFMLYLMIKYFQLI